MSPVTPPIKVQLPTVDVLEVTTKDGEVLLFERTDEDTAQNLVEEYGAPLSIRYHKWNPLTLAIAQAARTIERIFT